MADPRYPIGPFRFEDDADQVRRDQWIAEIAAAPGHLRAAVAGLGPLQLVRRGAVGRTAGRADDPSRHVADAAGVPAPAMGPALA
jgi:hypothetical protein